MAKVLEQFEFRSSVGKSSYPWQEWADGQIRQLTKGEDFTCKPNTLAMMARKHAKKQGVSVRVSAKEDSDTLVLQFYKPGDNGQGEQAAKKAKGRKS